MHIPSERVYREMNSESASLWYVPANGGKELACLIKAPTSSIKALIAGCPLKLIFGKKDNYLCTGVKILDMPDAPTVISGIQKELEEHSALTQALKIRNFPVFLFNEMDIFLAWTNVDLIEEEARAVLDFMGEARELYVGAFNATASHVLDCFCYSTDNTNIYLGADTIPILEIEAKLEHWRTNHSYFLGNHSCYDIVIDEKDEGEIFERAVWASLESFFPMTIHKSPQVKIGEKVRELTDVFSFNTYRSFLIEAKDLSVLNAGYDRDQDRKTAGVQKQVKKAIAQLIGASKALKRGDVIFGSDGTELNIDRKPPPHCIILITELMHYGDWKEIELQLMKAIVENGAYFHLLDLREFIILLKVSSGKAKLLDYNLMRRCDMFLKKQSIFIRSSPP